MGCQKQSKTKNFSHWETGCIFTIEHSCCHMLIQDCFWIQVMKFFQKLIHMLEIPEKAPICFVRSISWWPNKFRIPYNTRLLEFYPRTWKILIDIYLVSEWAQKKKSHLAVTGSWVIQFIMVFNFAAISSIPSTWQVISQENSCFPSLLQELSTVTEKLAYLKPFLAISSKYFCSFTRLNSASSRISKHKLIPHFTLK